MAATVQAALQRLVAPSKLEASLLVRDTELNLPLHYLAFAGWMEAGQYLLQSLGSEAGAAVNMQNKHGWTPLMGAAAQGHWHMVRLLGQVQGVDVNVQGESGESALHKAVRRTQVEVVQVLT